MTFQEYEGITAAFTNAKTKLTDDVSDFYSLKGERDVAKALYDLNAEEIRDQGIEAAHQGVSLISILTLGPLAPTAMVTELRQAITNAHLTAIDLAEGVRLAKALDIAINKTSELRTNIGNPKKGSQNATGLFKTRDDAYTAYVEAYKEYHGTPSATPPLSKGRNNAPIDNKSFSYGCFGSDDCDDKFGSPLAAMTSHFVQCQEKPHKAPEFGWYSCERSSCAKSEEHWRLCPGTCGEKFPPKKKYNSLYGIDSSYSASYPAFSYVDNFPHKVVCKEKVYDGFWNVITNTCYNKYKSVWYTCERSSCPNSTYHNDDDAEANAGGSLHACGIHDTSVSGNHTSMYVCDISPCSNRIVLGCLALCPETDNHGKVVCTISGCQDSTPYDPNSSWGGWHAPCDECSQYICTGGGHSWYPRCTDTTHTNANGDSCTAGGYECVSHTPVYPAPPPTTATCSQCSISYDPNGVHAWKHQPRQCVKEKWRRVDGRLKKLICTNTFYRCTNGCSTCQTGDIWCIDANGDI